MCNPGNMRVTLLVCLILLGNVPMQVEATSGRAITAEIVISDFVWDSDEDLSLIHI